MKLCSAIFLLGTFRQASASESGRYELVYEAMSITSTDPGLSGNFEIRTKEFIGYSIDYYDMVGVETPSTCLEGEFIQNDVKLAGDGSGTDFVETFELPVSVWNGGNDASVCVRVTNTYDEEVIDEIEVHATITRSFTGDFEISVSTKTKDTQLFQSTDNENEIDVNPFLCDNSYNEITNQQPAFAQGQGKKLYKLVVCWCR